MARQTKCRPCLPASLVEKFKADPLVSFLPSVVFKPATEKIRIDFVSTNVCSSSQIQTPNEPKDDIAAHTTVLSDYKISPTLTNIIDQEQNLTWLHKAVEHMDLPFAHELIRLGIPLDVQRRDGSTALQISLDYLLEFDQILRSLGTSPQSTPAREKAKRVPLIQERIAILLIEQHADVNLGSNGNTPLSAAVGARRWPLVDLLLSHGAIPPPMRQLQFKPASDRIRYKALVAKHKTPTARPPRPCPCWSGKLLADCHAAGPLPYPADFICKCGSAKVYAKCCSKRDFRIEERWEESRKCIAARSIGGVLLPKPDVNDPEAHAEQMRILNKSMGAIGLMAKDQESFRLLAAKMQSRRSAWIMRGFGARPDADPAYLYALLKASFFPR